MSAWLGSGFSGIFLCCWIVIATWVLPSTEASAATITVRCLSLSSMNPPATGYLSNPIQVDDSNDANAMWTAYIRATGTPPIGNGCAGAADAEMMANMYRNGGYTIVPFNFSWGSAPPPARNASPLPRPPAPVRQTARRTDRPQMPWRVATQCVQFKHDRAKGEFGSAFVNKCPYRVFGTFCYAGAPSSATASAIACERNSMGGAGPLGVGKKEGVTSAVGAREVRYVFCEWTGSPITPTYRNGHIYYRGCGFKPR